MAKQSVQDIQDRVINCVCEQLGVSRDNVNSKTDFINDLGADSLDHVELMMELEDEFNVNILDEDRERIRTVNDAVVCVSKLLA
ncbi:MAG: acyl carrier protein [Nanoarchaeota archaeon]|nr:acyl carrier protein [Nanoarchaeota archaeon]